MTQKFLGHPLLVFYSPTGSSATHIRGQWENHMCRIHAGSGKGPLSSGCFAIRRGLCRCPAMNWSARSRLARKVLSCVSPLTIDVWKRKGWGRSAARQDIIAETPVNFWTNEHPHKAARILITYWAIDYYANFNTLSNMLTPIKNQGDEHICILP